MKRLVLLLAALVPALVSADDYLDYKMIADSSNRFIFYVDARSTTPAGINYTTMQTVVEHAWDTWNNVSCASVKVRSNGASTSIPDPASNLDDFSVAPIWMLNRDADQRLIFGDSDFITSITLPRAYAGVLQTCDIYFNGAAWQWSTSDTAQSNVMDVETVMLHEAGHCLGIDHLIANNAVMEQVVESGLLVRELTAADVMALCNRYPTNGTVLSPCTSDSDCTGETGLRCLTHPVTQGVTQKLCTRGCTLNTNASCEVPTVCQASAGFSGFNGACLMPGTAVTQVGKACTEGNDCGNSNAECRLPESGNGGQDLWQDGYCTQRCEAGDPACPVGSTCVGLDVGQRCTQNCRVGYADCRSGYACQPIDQVETSGVCIPRCYADSDCVSSPSNPVVCRTCDGLCIPQNNPSGHIGLVCDPDLTSSTCAAGQYCMRTAAFSQQNSCVEQCGRGCTTCPEGSTCTATDLGQLLCLRNCSAPHTCPIGLQCQDTVSGKVCLPACSADLDCPVGQTCDSQGQCIPPESGDAGCNSLTCKPDAGKPIVIIPDAGTGGGGDGGCGCSSVDPAVIWLALGGLVLRRRKAQ